MATAGTLESGDILIELSPSARKGIDITLDSSVSYQFGEQIKKVITETLNGYGIDDAVVVATDKGALDCTIRARMAAAVERSAGVDIWDK